MSKYEMQRTTQFKKDYKVAVKRGFDTAPLKKVIALLASGEQLEPKLGDYKFKEGIDEDLRGGKGTFKEALDKVFDKIGASKEDFEVTKWGKDQYGKSHPMEWRAPNGAEVSVDIGHRAESGAPIADHVGW